MNSNSLTNGRIDPRLAMQQHMQRQLIGHLLRKIFIAQDFLAMYAYENEKLEIPDQIKSIIKQINDDLVPLIRMLGKITQHKRLNQITEWFHPNSFTTENTFIVYARVTMSRTGDLYIGETGDYTRRVKDHYMHTCKHRHDAPKHARDVVSM